MPVYQAIRPLLFKLLSPEIAHNLVVKLLHSMRASDPKSGDAILQTRVAGIDFPSPLGLAAGFDKDAKAPGKMLQFGFGFVEVGTVTPRPQAGNPGTRLFRLVEDEAIINRMGFNNAGLDDFVVRLQRRLRKGRNGVIGANIGANKDSVDRIADYVTGYRAVAPYVRYVTVNISSPNTPNLRGLQEKAALRTLLSALAEERKAGPPIFLKVAPDLTAGAIVDISELCIEYDVDALIVSNTTIARPDGLRSAHRDQQGGLSGKPLKPLALETMRQFRREAGPSLPLIGVGGISSAEDAYERLRAGASLVQLYTALAYQGVGLAAAINRGLADCLRRDGFRSVSEAVGTK